MQYTLYDSPQPESMFPVTSSTHQMTHSFPMDHPPNYNVADGTLFGPNYEPVDEAQGYHNYNMNNSEEGGDASRGPRLTQEQLAYLEGEFAQSYKPNTEYKKALAEQMRVDFAKVNNWFQNRRAKAKHEYQVQQRSDQSNQEPASPFIPVPIDYCAIPEAHSSGYYSSPEQPPYLSDDHVPPIDFGNVHELPPQYYVHDPAHGTAFATDQNYGNPTTNYQPNFSNSVTPQLHTQWPHDSYCGDIKVSNPSIVEVDTLGLLSEPQSIQSYSPDIAQGKAGPQGLPMYHDFVGGHLVSNPSSQSFGTSPSEEGEPTKLFTPPQEVSPLPGSSQGVVQHDRQASNSSDLADNLDTIHIRQSQSGSSARLPSANVSIPHAPSLTGLLSPEISPDTTRPKSPLEPIQDLASRRKRPRPAVLQPESSRSRSCVGPLATSPLHRISPPASGKLSPIRRIQSTGMNSNVMAGRIKKTNTLPAQPSPRNLETCFQLAAKPEGRPSAKVPAPSRHISNNNGHSHPDSPSIHPITHQTRDVLSETSSFQIPLPHPSWDQGAHSNVPNAYQNGFGWVPSQPDVRSTNVIHIPQEPFYSQQYHYSCPPQSAPPHITNFDTASAALDGSNGSWLVPSITPAPYRDDTQLSIPLRQNVYPPDNSSGIFNYYQVAGPSFQSFPSGLGQFQPCLQYSNRPPSPPHKALDIKVDIGPSPPKEMVQTSQERKEYTFENTFPGDLLFKSGSKK